MKYLSTNPEDGMELIKGIRVRNGSIKIYKKSDGRFIILLKKYFWNFRIKSEFKIADSFEEAEDYFISARFDGKIN